LVIITCVGFLARLYVALNAVSITGDSPGYISMAMEFLGEEPLILEKDFWAGLSAIRRPLYPMLLGLTSFLVEDYELAGRTVSLVLGTLIIPLGFYMGRLVYDERAGLTLALFLAVHPYMIHLSGEVLTDALFHFLFTAMTLCSLAALSRQSVSLMWVAGLIAILAFLTRPGPIIAWGFITLWALYHSRGSLRKGFAVAGSTVLLLMVFGILVITGKTGGTAVSGNPFLNVLAPIYSVSSSHSSMGVKLIKFVQEFPQGITYPFLFLFIVGLAKSRKEGLSPSERCLLVATVPLWLAYLVVSPSERYFSHAMAPALVFASAGFAHLNEWSKSKLRGRTGLITAILVFAIIAMQLPRGFVELHPKRLPEKLAGQWILEHEGSGRTIISDSGVTAFYARGYFVGVPKKRLRDAIDYGKQMGADYLVGYGYTLGGFIPDFETEKAR
jgi:4-amino-4-deoxy-L-arabinose transferase-like glycosyltransferase